MPFVSAHFVEDQSYDFIIAGGGTAGLLLAERLSADPSTSVLVIDAGNLHLDDPLIVRPAQFGATFMEPSYDWGFMTVPQTFCGDKQVYWPRGKSLGGSSAMNFSCWSIPADVDIDAWERLGNPNWTFQAYQTMMHNLSSYAPNGPECGNSKYEPELLRSWKEPFGKGELKIAQPKHIMDIQQVFQETFANMNVPVSADPNNGDPTGRYLCATNADPTSNERSYSANTFLFPHIARRNLHVVLNALVHRLHTSGEQELTAEWVEFSCADDVHKVRVKKEVVLCAGALKSPQILELSGIGRKEVLTKIGVPVKLALDGVGENIQEHTYWGIAYELKDDACQETYDILRNPDIMAEHVNLFKQGQGLYTSTVTSFAYLPMSTVSTRSNALLDSEKASIASHRGTYPPGLAEQYDIMLSKIEAGVGSCEVIAFPGYLSAPNPPAPNKKYASFIAVTNSNFSRGTIHAKSDSPLDNPDFDPRYFEHDIDLQIVVDMVKYVRQVVATAPFSQMIESPEISELNPGASVQSDEDIAAWVKANVGSIFHTVGSLSMLPKEKNGVVDSRLKVYGTSNIRVADLSVVPLHFTGHSVATAYAIGEFAASIIKGNF